MYELPYVARGGNVCVTTPSHIGIELCMRAFLAFKTDNLTIRTYYHYLICQSYIAMVPYLFCVHHHDTDS